VINKLGENFREHQLASETLKQACTKKLFEFSLTFCLPKFHGGEAHVSRRDGCTTHTYEPQVFHTTCLDVKVAQPN